MSAVGDRIRLRRQQLRFTQERLAADANMSKGFLSEVETGTRNPSAEYLMRVADALGVSLDFLMKGDVEAPEKLVQFPARLAAFAREKDLPFTVTRAILEARLQIVANRRNVGGDDLETFDWEGFYNAIKDYL